MLELSSQLWKAWRAISLLRRWTHAVELDREEIRFVEGVLTRCDSKIVDNREDDADLIAAAGLDVIQEVRQDRRRLKHGLDRLFGV